MEDEKIAIKRSLKAYEIVKQSLRDLENARALIRKPVDPAFHSSTSQHIADIQKQIESLRNTMAVDIANFASAYNHAI